MTSRVGLLNYLAGLVVATLVTLAVLVPQLRDARADRDVLQSNVDSIAKACTFYEDGSATCPPETFDNPPVRP